MVLITVLALTPLFRSLPEATLGAVVIHAVWHLIDLSKLSRYRQIKSSTFGPQLSPWLACWSLAFCLV